MNSFLSVVIAVISLVMMILSYGDTSEAIAWVLSFTGWAAIAIYQRELNHAADKTT